MHPSARGGGRSVASGARLLQDDPEFGFEDPMGWLVVRHLRVWETFTGPVAVVTETPECEGMSITNAAESMVRAVRKLWPRYPDMPIVEHYTCPDRFAAVYADGTGGARWEHVDTGLLLACLGLDQYPPT